MLGNFSLRNRLSSCLHEYLMKNNKDKHFNRIIFEVNKLMNKFIDPINGYKQAIEYKEINMKKLKLILSGKEDLENLDKMIKENREFMNKFEDIKIEGFKFICDKFDSIFEKKVFVNENEKEIRICDEEKLDLKSLFKFLDTTWYITDNENKHFKILIITNRLLESIDEDIVKFLIITLI